MPLISNNQQRSRYKIWQRWIYLLVFLRERKKKYWGSQTMLLNVRGPNVLTINIWIIFWSATLRLFVLAMRFCVYCFINKLFSNFLFSNSIDILLLFCIEWFYQINADFHLLAAHATYTAIRVIDAQHMPIIAIIAYSRLLVWSVCIQVPNMHHVYLVSVVICIIFMPYASSWDLLDKIRQDQIKRYDSQNDIMKRINSRQITVTNPPAAYNSTNISGKVCAAIIILIAKCVYFIIRCSKKTCCCCCGTDHNEDNEGNTTFDV